MTAMDYVMMAVELLGGLGMFLFGMNAMGEGLEKSAGKKMQQIIETLTSNVFKGVLVGIVVTAIIQSSSATTVMVVGFVSAGVMTLMQATGVILGANIGTTITAQILRLSDIEGGGILTFFKPDFLAPVAIIVGVGLIMFSKSKKAKDVGGIFAGFGVLFIGMDFMGNAVEKIKDQEWVRYAFTVMGENPILGILTGTGITALIQSSSASVGILQEIASKGVVAFGTAVPILLGQNLGTCITAVLSAIGASKSAKRAAAVHLTFNIIEIVLTCAVIYGIQAFVGIPGWDEPITRGGIADFHTIYNIANVIVILPFYKLLVKIVYMIIPEKGKHGEKENLLDERLLNTPAAALSQALKAMTNMLDAAVESFKNSTELIFNADKGIASKLEEIAENEEVIDIAESDITKYLVKISERDLTVEENNASSGLFHSIMDIERIGDHAVNISEIAENMYNNEIKFSSKAVTEIRNMISAVEEIMQLCMRAYKDNDIDAASRIQPLESVIDILKRDLRQYHINRLTKQECDINAGIAFLDLVNNLERISDHCSNIGIAAQQRINAISYDPHDHSVDTDIKDTAEYKGFVSEYTAKYCAC